MKKLANLFNKAGIETRSAAYTEPSISDEIHAYYELTGDEKAKQAIISAGEYVSRDIPVTEFDTGISLASILFLQIRYRI